MPSFCYGVNIHTKKRCITTINNRHGLHVLCSKHYKLIILEKNCNYKILVPSRSHIFSLPLHPGSNLTIDKLNQEYMLSIQISNLSYFKDKSDHHHYRCIAMNNDMERCTIKIGIRYGVFCHIHRKEFINNPSSIKITQDNLSMTILCSKIHQNTEETVKDLIQKNKINAIIKRNNLLIEGLKK